MFSSVFQRKIKTFSQDSATTLDAFAPFIHIATGKKLLYYFKNGLLLLLLLLLLREMKYSINIQTSLLSVSGI